MGIFGSTSWTGREPGGSMVMERPPVRSEKLQACIVPAHKTHMEEYASLAAAVGIRAPDVDVDTFRLFLQKHDIPTFSLAEVVSYMDAKAAKESKDQCGWQWHPLRAKDHREGLAFGTKPTRTGNHHSTSVVTTPASDYYEGPHQVTEHYQTQQGGTQPHHRKIDGSATPYDKTIPLHALRKVALIDQEFGQRVAIFVCDYALAPAIQYPDPFLMAVVANPSVRNGTGRFIIDFWDEPGFGLDKMLK